MMKIVIDIPEGLKKDFESEQWTALSCMEMKDALMNGTPLEQEPNTWGLDDAREDFMHDVYNILDFLPTNNEANWIIDSFDRVTIGIKQESCVDAISRQYLIEKATNWDKHFTDSERYVSLTDVKNAPPVTPQPKTG